MLRLIWVFAGRTIILLVLSCRGSYCISSMREWPDRFYGNDNEPWLAERVPTPERVYLDNNGPWREPDTAKRNRFQFRVTPQLHVWLLGNKVHVFYRLEILGNRVWIEQGKIKSKPWCSFLRDCIIFPSESSELVNTFLFVYFNYENSFLFRIHVKPPRSSGSLPEMQPDSRNPGSETEPPRCENTKKKEFFFFFFLNNFPDHHFCAYIW